MGTTDHPTDGEFFDWTVIQFSIEVFEGRLNQLRIAHLSIIKLVDKSRSNVQTDKQKTDLIPPTLRSVLSILTKLALVAVHFQVMI
jgi:hypothetical protein